ncbi:pseudomurein-binding protein [Methanothermobacter marburgensis]|uniref:Predicted pseudomurein-binding protein n=1 Tax=Methanothermobacter marburgensis (strain ATCC BAA-927 / DSM 2133 / JCM 14651 / NBRC 100331 / OCM 82 / Marburg) TaxID=79929 RepID=D9PX88_METTM|nr:pseudomurein-binding repeat-containing protein [Methanothermobacter marburgensis]ADL58836.1 predicted pseudomurein-binding protein [Methanothermobacter marburgensis str. Marburg]WBF09386.1 pseudomurein-binding protein [Methanothermobacter marburgensis]
MREINVSVLVIMFLFLVSPAAGAVFVTDSSHTIITAPAAAHTKSGLVVSSYTPEKSVLKYVKGMDTVVVGDVKVNGTRIPARTSSLARYWSRSNVVVLGTGSDISAAYAAIKNDAPLLISGKTLPSATKTEIKRLKPKKIIICAPASAIPSSSLKGLGIPYQRVWYGSDSATLSALQPKSGPVIMAPRSLLPVAMTLWRSGVFSTSTSVRVNGTVLWSSCYPTTSVIMNRYASGTPETIYLSSDRLNGVNGRTLMESIKAEIAGSARVIIDERSPAPGEADRAIKNAPPGSLAVYIAAACPGTMYSTISGIKSGYLRSYASSLDGVAYVNYGSLNLEKTSYLSRAWDDNFSNVYFAGINKPSEYLRSAGILLLEPKVLPQSQQVHFTAMNLIDYAYSADGEHLRAVNSSVYIARHEIDPTTLSADARRIVSGNTTEMAREEWVYLASQYIAGLPIRKNTTAISGASSSSNTYTGTLTRAEYRDAARRVYEFAKTNRRLPAYVSVGDKKLGRDEYTLMFAQIIQNHTDKSKMVFPSSVKVGESLIDTVVQFIKDLIT